MQRFEKVAQGKVQTVREEQDFRKWEKKLKLLANFIGEGETRDTF